MAKVKVISEQRQQFKITETGTIAKLCATVVIADIGIIIAAGIKFIFFDVFRNAIPGFQLVNIVVVAEQHRRE